MALFDPAETLTYGNRTFRIAMELDDQEHSLLRYSFSAGFALAVSGESVDHMLRRADKAMYGAKVEGRGWFIKSDCSAISNQDFPPKNQNCRWPG